MLTVKPAARLSRLILLGSMAFSAGVLGEHLDHDSVKRLREEGRILSMSEMMRRAALIQPGQLLDAELEQDAGRYVYEIRILDMGGRIHEFKLDASSGALIESPPD